MLAAAVIISVVIVRPHMLIDLSFIYEISLWFHQEIYPLHKIFLRIYKDKW